jgi:hypothetical protein
LELQEIRENFTTNEVLIEVSSSGDSFCATAFNDNVEWSATGSDELSPGYFFRKPDIHLQDCNMCLNPVYHNIRLKKIFITCLFIENYLRNEFKDKEIISACNTPKGGKVCYILYLVENPEDQRLSGRL